MREVAKRVFAKEYADSNLVVREGNTEYAPSYVVTPTGAKCNRVFVSGVLTEIEKVGDEETYRARISDPTGQFLAFAGEYQPEAAKFLSEAEVPSFISIYGKTNVYKPDEETVITSIRPESINYCKEIDRDRWVVKTALHTLKRLKNIDKKPREHYQTEKETYKNITKEALEVTIQTEKTPEETQKTQEEQIKKEKPKSEPKSPEKQEKTEETIETSSEPTEEKEIPEEPGFEKSSKKTQKQEKPEDELEDEFLEEIISGSKKNQKQSEKEDDEEIEEWDLSE